MRRTTASKPSDLTGLIRSKLSKQAEEKEMNHGDARSEGSGVGRSQGGRPGKQSNRIIVISLVYLAIFLMYEAVKYAAFLSWSNGGGPLI